MLEDRLKMRYEYEGGFSTTVLQLNGHAVLLFLKSLRNRNVPRNNSGFPCAYILCVT